jgi:hypothetical protein
MEQLQQMKRAVVIAEQNAGECRKKIYLPQPLFDGRFEFSLQYGRDALWLLSHPASLSHVKRFRTGFRNTFWNKYSPTFNVVVVAIRVGRMGQGT